MPKHAATRRVAETTNNPVETLTTDEARQGVTGHNVRYILLVSLVGALIAGGVAWAWVSNTVAR
jgi:hypothetical protein